MLTATDIKAMLPQLEAGPADGLEGQNLDFKRWDGRSREQALGLAVEMAVCMANGGGGTVVFGVADGVVGREQAILGVPPEVDVHLLKKAIYERTDPKITPVFEELPVAEGTGRLLLMQIHPGLPPYTDTAGRGTVRIGKDCMPLTGTVRRKIGAETGETDYTADLVAKTDARLLSAPALETLRDLARVEGAPEDLLNQADKDLLSQLNLTKKGQFTRAALMLAGTEAAIRQHLPGHNWTFLQMASDTGYGIREDGVGALPVAVQRLEQLLAPFNPITTYEQGLFHYEYHTWPKVALREALMNAFCHADFRIAGPVMVKLHAERLDISNNGGFIAGITPDNILHHQPAARNPLLVEALTRLRLVNRSNLGIGRIFSALLMEGKEPPLIRELGDSVLVSFPKRELNAPFRIFVADEAKRGHALTVNELLLLRHLLHQGEVDMGAAAALCQVSEPEALACLAAMETAGYLESMDSVDGSRWSLAVGLHRRLRNGGRTLARHQADWTAAKARVLDALAARARRGEPGLGNKEIRQLVHFDRNQVFNLMTELRDEQPGLRLVGRGRYARYEYGAGTGQR